MAAELQKRKTDALEQAVGDNETAEDKKVTKRQLAFLLGEMQPPILCFTYSSALPIRTLTSSSLPTPPQLRERRQVEDADHELTDELFGGGASAKGVHTLLSPLHTR